jgi:hypothetical protein
MLHRQVNQVLHLFHYFFTIFSLFFSLRPRQFKCKYTDLDNNLLGWCQRPMLAHRFMATHHATGRPSYGPPPQDSRMFLRLSGTDSGTGPQPKENDMPSRTFRIYIANATNVPLTRVAGDEHLHGAFTPGGWTPPNTIPPGQTLAFQAESDGLAQGTDGHVVYQIDDGKTVAERVRIDWNNPFWGVTNSTGQMQVSTGFFEDRTNGSSANYVLEGGGRRPSGENTGPIITAGWAEIVPGLVALPIPMLGIEPHAWSMFVVRDRSTTSSALTPSFGEPASAPELRFEPVVSARASVWAGAWERVAASASVKVLISKNQSIPNSVATVLGYQTFLVSIEERSKLGGTVSISQPAVAEELLRELPYGKETWPPTAPSLPLHPRVPSFLQSHAEHVYPAVTAPSASSPALGVSSGQNAEFSGREARTSRFVASRIGGLSVGNAVVQAPSATRLSDLAETKSLRITEEADGLVIEQGLVTLMLYAARNRTTGDLMGFGIRYTRRHAEGDLVADTMLLPAFRAPA